jgi:hypothetical protein
MKIRSSIPLAAALLSGACGGELPDWDEREHVLMYVAALEALRETVAVDTLVVEPRPRFLTGEPTALAMGDFSEFEEPIFSNAIEASAGVVACEIERGAACGPGAHPRRVSLSEITPLGARDAGLMAAYVDMRGTSVVTRLLRLQLRYRGGRWRVIRVVDEGAE